MNGVVVVVAAALLALLSRAACPACEPPPPADAGPDEGEGEGEGDAGFEDGGDGDGGEPQDAGNDDAGNDDAGDDDGGSDAGNGDSDGDGWTVEAGDCDDGDVNIHPDAVEVCNGDDDDCDGDTDDDDSQVTGQSTWYLDSDGDGFGNELFAVDACQMPEDHVANGADCDDSAPGITPDAPEVCDGLGIDENCNGVFDDEGPSCAWVPPRSRALQAGYLPPATPPMETR